ncbi:MAG: NAD(P)/FAD-dependent oxidoreductase, partial [Bacteroidota bacterium]
LTAAIHCERAGFSPTMIEATDRVGGRIKTDAKDGYLLDHGFQVLLSEYEEAKRYLDFKQLGTQAFEPGAVIYDDKGSYLISDPLRQPSQLFKVAFSRVGTLQDKWLMFRLTQSLKGKKRQDLFRTPQQSTLSFLQKYGFSKRIIEHFFKPFFGGIFLEHQLSTSAAMFQFVFKLFSEGDALLPQHGIEAIPQQLKAQLDKTSFHFSKKVTQVQGNQVQLDDGNLIDFDKLIIATDPGPMLKNLSGPELPFVATTCLYYACAAAPIPSRHIGLVSNPKSPINNFCVLNKVSADYAPTGKYLVSVTLKDKAALSEDSSLIEQVAQEIQQLTSSPRLDYLARYDIKKALPVIDELQYELPNTQFTLTDDIYLAGDYLLNASLDAAMRSGRLAAQAMIDSL